MDVLINRQMCCGFHGWRWQIPGFTGVSNSFLGIIQKFRTCCSRVLRSPGSMRPRIWTMVFFQKWRRMFWEPWKLWKLVCLVFLFWIQALLHLQWSNVDRAWLCPSGMFCWYRCHAFWFATRSSAAATAVFFQSPKRETSLCSCYCTDSTDAVQSFRRHLSCSELSKN